MTTDKTLVGIQSTRAFFYFVGMFVCFLLNGGLFPNANISCFKPGKSVIIYEKNMQIKELVVFYGRADIPGREN